MEFLGLHPHVIMERMRHLEVSAFEGFRSGILNNSSNWMQKGETCGIVYQEIVRMADDKKGPRNVKKSNRREGK